MRSRASPDLKGAVEAFRSSLAGDVQIDVPLARFTTYRIGGPAAVLVEPASPNDVAAALEICVDYGLPWVALGFGSNVLVADAGYDGVVIRIGKYLKHVEAESKEAGLWSVGAGLPTPRLARLSAEAGWSGVQRLIGVPGTIGGGVYMNAGAHGQDFGQVVRRIDLVRLGGGRETIGADALPWHYRDAGIRDAIVVGCSMQLARAPVLELKEDIRKHFRWRQRGTPFNEPCCGSVFRNPNRPIAGERRTAGQLIDAAGLKGYTQGGAQVSTKHANYIVNIGHSTAADVRRVIDTVRERVRRRFDVDLRLEVQMVGGEVGGAAD